MPDIDYEHLTFKNGEVNTIAFVDIKKTKGIDIWIKIDEVIRDYTELHPREVWTHLQYNKAVKETRHNAMGTSRNNASNMRWGISMPMGLAFKIQALDYEFFENKKKVHKFMKRYPGWRTCKTV